MSELDLNQDILDYDEDDDIDYQASIDFNINNSEERSAEEGIEDPLSQCKKHGSQDPVLDPAMEEMLETCAPSTSAVIKSCNTNYLDSFLESMMTNNESNGPPVQDTVAKFFKNQLNRDFVHMSVKSTDECSNDSATVLTKMRNIRCPSNVPELKPCTVNSSVYRVVPAQTKRVNLNAQLSEQAICMSMAKQAELMQGLLDLKDEIKPSGAEKLQELLKLTGNSVELLSFARTRANVSRRDLILANINNNYKALGSKTAPGDGLLFGNNLTEAMKDVEDSYKLSKKLSKSSDTINPSKKDFLGRGRGRRRGQRTGPYQTQFQTPNTGFQSQTRDFRQSRGRSSRGRGYPQQR